MSPPFSEQGGCGEREGVPAGHLSVDSPARPPSLPRTSFTSMLA